MSCLVLVASSQDIDSLIAQMTALTWEDPSSQLETLPHELVKIDWLPLVGQLSYILKNSK
jgi:hypothetical protein